MKPTYKQYPCRRSTETLCTDFKCLNLLVFMNFCFKRLISKFFCRYLLNIFFIVFLLSFSIYADSGKLKKNRVLVLLSYNRTNIWTENVLGGILTTLEPYDNIELFVEYMDTKRFLSVADSKRLKSYIQQKYHNTKLDAVLLSDNNALDFVIDNRRELFDNIPVVFCGINNYSEAILKGQKGISGYQEAIDIPATLECILKLFPATKTIYVISDMTPSGQADKKQFDKVAGKFTSRVEFKPIMNYSTDQLKKKLHSLPAESAVLVLSFHRDSAGIVYTVPSFMRMISNNTSSPVFSLWDHHAASGAVGGKVVYGRKQGEMAAQMLIEILRGDKKAGNVIHLKSPNVYIFDDSQLKRFGVTKEHLPENSIVMNQTFSFYEKYTIYIWLGIIIIIIQSLSISGLIINVRLRRRGQRALAASEKKFRSYMENAPDAVLIVNEKGQFVEFNQVACNLLGYTRQELLTKSIMDISPEDAHDEVGAHFGRVLSTGKTDGVVPFRKSNGENRWWSVDAVKLTSERYIGFARDVTEARRAETVLLNARQKELQVGIEIQNQLLLGKTPTTLKGAKVAACSIPSDYIDGDFYDFIQYDNQHFDLILGDVMGKGVSAALCGAATKAQFLRVIYDLMCSSTLATIPTIEEIVSFAHEQMCIKLMKIESFVTTCVARFNLRKMRMDLIDCGHPSTIHYHSDTQECDLIVGKNFPIGFNENETYEQLSVHFKVGDILFFHSDGVMETKDHNNNIYGMKRLEQFIRDNSELSPDELTKKLAAELKHFSNNKFTDDITYIFVKFEEASTPELLRSMASEFSSEFENVNKIREMIEADISDVEGVDSKFCAELILAVSEAVTNIIKHAYDYKPDFKIFVGIEIYTDHIEIILSHCGTAMEKRQFTTPSFDGSQNNGYGLYLIRNCVDEIKLSKDDHGIISMQLIKKTNSNEFGESSVKRF